MANTESDGVASSWPLPPSQYIDLYTDDAVTEGTTPLPPTPMSSEPYTMFGCPFFPNESIIRSLESQKFKRLYPSNYDHKKELKRMNHSLLANFLDLIDILVKCPDSEKRVEKIEDLKILFINMHHLINEYRQHQARETIRVMMAVQKKQRIEIAERFQRQLDKVAENLQNYLANMPDVKPLHSIKTDVQGILKTVDEKPSTDNNELSKLSSQLSSLDRMMAEIIDEFDNQIGAESV